MQEEQTNNVYLRELTQEKYKYGFTTDVHTDIIEKGLNEDIIRLISSKKNEPEWLLEFRLKAYRHWLTMEMPTWAHLNIPEIDYQDISYYADPTKKKEGPKSMDEVDPELIKTFNKLGIPLEEQMALSGMAVDAVMDSVSVKTTFKEELKEKGMKRFVLDLRGNGGGLMSEAINIVSLFVPKGSLVVTSKGNTEDSAREYRTTTEPIDTQIPIIVMIDSASASSSEIVTGALQDMDRATVMGKRSYGKGLVQSIKPLPYNGQMKITTAKYYTPSGRCVQAIDYSNRNEDGSVGHIPDSLTREFKTAGGRIVRDGGGITPDIEVDVPSYSRLVYSLVLGGVVDQYTIDYARRHKSIPAVDEFYFSDEDFEDFIAFAKTQEFDYRSSAKTYYDKMKKELEEDGLAEAMADELKALEKALEMDKERFIRLKKDEIIPFLEEEIATRFWFQEAGVKVRLRYDKQLMTALEKAVNIN